MPAILPTPSSTPARNSSPRSGGPESLIGPAPEGGPPSDRREIPVIGTAELPSPLGPLLVAFTPVGRPEAWHLVSLDFAPFAARYSALLGKRFARSETRPALAPELLADALEAWFAGFPEALAEIPQNGGGTAFQEKTWRALREIPLGETRAYRDIAAAIGAPTAIRAVARANALNPIAIATPCHRVIGADGTLTGYAGGLSRKAWLLDHERAMANGELSGPVAMPGSSQ